MSHCHLCNCTGTTERLQKHRKCSFFKLLIQFFPETWVNDTWESFPQTASNIGALLSSHWLLISASDCCQRVSDWMIVPEYCYLALAFWQGLSQMLQLAEMKDISSTARCSKGSDCFLVRCTMSVNNGCNIKRSFDHSVRCWDAAPWLVRTVVCYSEVCVACYSYGAALGLVLVDGTDDVVRVAEILQKDLVELTLLFCLQRALLRQKKHTTFHTQHDTLTPSVFVCPWVLFVAATCCRLTKSEKSLWASRWRCCTLLTAIEKRRWPSVIGWEDTPRDSSDNRNSTERHKIEQLGVRRVRRVRPPLLLLWKSSTKPWDVRSFRLQ